MTSWEATPYGSDLHKAMGLSSICTPEKAIYVGDSIVDYEVARQSNVPFVAYKHPQLRADYHIDDLRELLSIVTVDERQSL